MSVRCPYCSFTMQLKGAHAGRFSPRCQQCKQKFTLIVSGDPDKPPVAAPLPEDLRGAKPQAAPVAAAAVAGRAAHDSTIAPIDPSAGATLPPPTARPSAPHPAGAGFSEHDSLAAAIADAEASLHGHEHDSDAQPEPPGARSGHRITLEEIGRTAAPPASPSPAQRAAEPASVTAAPHHDGEAHPADRDGAHREVHSAPRASASSPLLDPALRDIERGGRLGGYEIRRKLGQGGMGAVYLARQISLDRDVAVKVLAPGLAHDPAFVARFTREAYAAAQLVHHNIVQIHDIGDENDIHFFSMEFVAGQTLAGSLKDKGQMAPEAAASHVLQAARGLKFAHDHAMIHRDIKPENLLLGSEGMLKVADLGLVKRQGTADDTASPALIAASNASQTAAAAMGTPAYMAPEQAKDASKVDVRADIYSLGCTLYDLLTGRPPFVGKTIAEVLKKHESEKPTPPERLVKDIPKPMSAIVLKMIAKKPEDRYANMGEVIAALEEYLGVGNGPLAPREQDAETLEAACEAFNGASMAKARKAVIGSFFGICAAGAAALLYLTLNRNSGADFLAAGALACLATLAFFSYVLIAGASRRTHLFIQLRQYAMASRWSEWLYGLIFIGVACGLLYAFGLQWISLACLVAAPLLALLFINTIDASLSRQRQVPVMQVEQMLRQMRLASISETSIREFVCRYSGDRWEEFYETLFGYDAKMLARRRWGTSTRGGRRRKWGAWRDPIIAWIDTHLRVRREEKEREYLARVEERKLKAAGVAGAASKAKRFADRAVARAERVREMSLKESLKPAPASAVEGSGLVVKAEYIFDEEAHEDDRFLRRRSSYIERYYGSIWGLLLGARVRFLVGLGILFGFMLWMYQDNPNFLRDLQHRSVQTITRAHNRLAGEPIDSTEQLQAVQIKTPSSELKAEPDQQLDQVISQTNRQKVLSIIGSFAGGLAGAILVFSVFFPGARIGVFMALSVFLILFGGRFFPIPTLGLVQPQHAGMAAGSVLAVFAFLFEREY